MTKDRRLRPLTGARIVGRRRGILRGSGRVFLALILATGCLVGSAAAAQDRMTVVSGGGLPGATVSLPLAIRDLSGTLLNEGAGADQEIQGFAFRIDFAPAAAIQSVNFVQAGVTAGKTPVFPVIQPSPDHIVVLMNFDEDTDPLVFTLNAAAPGNTAGLVVFEIDPGASLGTTVTLTIEVDTATLINGSATVDETVANGHLGVVDGTLTIDSLIFADGFESGNLIAWSASVP